MRSLIKMDVSKYPNFDAVAFNQLPFKQEQARHSGAATHHSMRVSLKRNAIYSHNNSYRNETHDRQQTIEQKNEYPKRKSIQKYISDLTDDIQNPRLQPDFGETKFRALKRIIQHYDIKTMERNQYSKLIKTFGLQIQPMKASEKQRNAIRTHHQNRSFKIKQSARGQSRLSSLKNRVSGDGDNHEVALLQFSKQLIPTDRKHHSPDEKYLMSQRFSQKLATRYKQKFRININKLKSKQNSPDKKMSPFKFKSSQDVILEKLNKYREFLFILNCSNHLYRKMNIEQYQTSLKFYVGPGNNSNLIKSLLKKRFYFEQTNKFQEANFVWSQIKIDSIFSMQKNSTTQLSENLQKKISARQTRAKFFNNVELEENLLKIVTKKEANLFIKLNQQFFKKINNLSFEDKLKFIDKNASLPQKQQKNIVHNHLQSNGLLGNKKGMFYCIREYYKLTGRNVWQILPLTFHISKGLSDNQFKQFHAYYNERKKNKLPNIWIMKPGQFSNRGNGISCSNKIQQIKKRASKCQSGKHSETKTLILQLYISNPMLYNNRKFDIRAYMLVTCHNGKIKAYWYQEGYVRTSSYFFDLNQLADNDIHLTNDAIQKQSQNYGKFQPGNKLSYMELQRYFNSLQPNGRNLDFFTNALPKMKQIAAESLMSSFMFLDQSKKQNNFQIFGLDFMLDWNLKPWLIEINTNPCLELSCPLLQRIIPHMVENAFRIGLDTIFPPPDDIPHNYKFNIAENALHYNKFQIIFDEERDGPQIRDLYKNHPSSIALVQNLMGIQQDQQIYKEEGILCDYDL